MPRLTLALLLSLITFCQGGDAGTPSLPRFPDLPDVAKGMEFRKLPCPNPEDILPCTCTATESSEMDMDCSHVESEEQLERVFSATFPFSTFRNFTMYNNTFLTELRNQSLGIASFTGVYITNSVLEAVESYALSNSFGTAQVINMQNNLLSSFPFATVSSFTSLLELDLSDNQLTFPAIESESLLMLDLSNNLINNVSVATFSGVTQISEINMSGNQIPEIPTGTFAGHHNLYHVNLAGNKLTYVPEGAIQLTSSRPGTVILKNNNITSIAVNGITDVANGEVDVSSNAIQTMEEDVYRPILTDGATLDINNNPLTCGCDIAWLIRSKDLLESVAEGAACFDNELLIELDPEMFDNMNCFKK
ncbi:oplophorus-luciferin 2-monooxygenase non-catalytic subunit-like [Penaeus indicus]|uniref:oplophorus-luciferin 2-monooxygenase non-catalytic subunit-like n=1 Tax=Penaeus indicus TaxID=29960 RepID=UPI00300CA768